MIENVLLVSLIVALAIYFLFVYLIDRKQRNFLWFGLFCLITAMRLSVINEAPLKVVWPHMPYALITYFRYKSLNEKLRSLNSSLTEYSLISRKKDEFEQKLLQQLAILDKRDDQENADSVKDVIRQLNQKPNMPIGHQIVLDNMEKINSDFISRLKKRYSNLTPTEQELCICLKANLSNRDIANLRNISPDSVKKAKGRLRKKIAIDESEDLLSFLNAI